MTSSFIDLKMGVLIGLNQVIYNFIVWTGIMNLIVTIIQPIQSTFFTVLSCMRGTVHNYEVVDASGHKLCVLKLKDRIYPPFGEDHYRSISDMKVRPDDVMICGYPKTGCHWMFEILYMLRRGKAQLSKHGKRFGGMIDIMPSVVLDSLWSPRVLNSHLLYHELPSEIQKMKTKIILTVRNPKDTVVSFYNHERALPITSSYKGSFNDYFELFIEGKLEYGDYFDHLLHWEEIMKSQTTNPVLMVPYEEMKSDPVKWVLRVATFLESPITHQFAQEVVEACEFNKMKEKRKINLLAYKVFRKGIVGDWKNWLTDDQSEAIDQKWKNKMARCVYQPYKNTKSK